MHIIHATGQKLTVHSNKTICRNHSVMEKFIHGYMKE